MTPELLPTKQEVAEALASVRASIAASSPETIQVLALRLYGLAGDELAEAIDRLADELVGNLLAACPQESDGVAHGLVIAAIEEALGMIVLMPPTGRA